MPSPQLSEEDQELYKNFPITISDKWQQEIAGELLFRGFEGYKRIFF